MRKKIILFGGLAMLCQTFTACKKTDQLVKTIDTPSDSTPVEQITVSGTDMVIESLNGTITANEIAAFKNFMTTQKTPANNDENIWVFGAPGNNTEACGHIVDEGKKTIQLLIWPVIHF